MKASVILVGLLMLGQAHAQTSTTKETKASGETKVKLEDAKGKNKANTQGQEDIDEVITNRKLRAEAGSKSKFSVSTSWNYSGGSVKSPADAVRPNITGASATATDVALSGSVAGSYRANPLMKVDFGTGLRVSKPFHSDKNRDLGERSKVDNPYVGVKSAYKVLGVQNVTSLTYTYYTSDAARKPGYFDSLSAYQTMIYDFGGSKASVGLLLGASMSRFDKTNSLVAVGKNKAGVMQYRPAQDLQSNYDLGAYPFLELELTDKLNLRTISGLWVYEHDRTADSWTFSKNKIYQSVGLGISVTRDIYLYPNVQFLPEDIRSDLTNVAVSASINIL